MIYRFDTLTSTNDEARRDCYAHGDIVVADKQTAGRGQRGHTWLSARGENLTFTLVVEPSFLAARDQFRLLEAVAVALCDCFEEVGITTRIKWTNDIYHENSKLVGILIEHFYAGDRLRKTLVGIGINVNQPSFDASLPNPVSMRQIAGHEFDRRELLERFAASFERRFEELKAGKSESLRRAYHDRIYHLGQKQHFRLPDGTPLTATIEGVEEQGALLLRHADSSLHSYQFKEVEFVIKSDR